MNRSKPTTNDQIEIGSSRCHHHQSQRCQNDDNNNEMLSALKIVKKFEAKTTTYRNKQLQIDWNSVELGEELGRGAFSTVYQVSVSELTTLNNNMKVNNRRKKQSNDNNNNNNENIISINENGDGGVSGYFSGDDNDNNNNNNKKNDKNYYALKCLRRDKINGKKQTFIIAAIDLMMEAEILSQLNHENIITLRGVCSGRVTNSFLPSHGGYFLILDQLNGTLRDKLQQWEKKEQKHKSKLSSSKTISSAATEDDTTTVDDSIVGKEDKQQQQQQQNDNNKYLRMAHIRRMKRIETVGLQIAKGMEYIHNQNIIMRDLKPENVGFDAKTGIIKLFDFGLARHCNSKSFCKHGEIAGSIRYMAPEARLGKGNKKVSDVYSYGVMLWELCTLIKPFNNFQTIKEFNDNVIKENYRPHLSRTHIPSKTLRNLIRHCWATDEIYRPEFIKIIEKIQYEIKIMTKCQLR